MKAVVEDSRIHRFVCSGAVLTACVCATTAAAQQPVWDPAAASVELASASTATQLAPIVVTASGYEQKIPDAPASITVVDRADLQNKPYAGLADALRDIEGIDVGSGFDKNGNISITLRGLPSDYTLVLIDGRRQSDIGDIGPNNFGNSQFMYIPPLEAIERIEIVRGPMSTLYGADAIGGVINIITRKVNPVWVGSITQSLTLQQDSQYGDENRTDFYATGPLIQNLLGMGVRASLFDRDETSPGYAACLPLPETDINGDPNPECYQDAGNFGDKKIVAARNWNVGATFTLTPSPNHDVRVEYDIARQRYDNTEGQTGTLDSVESLWRASNAGIVQPRVGYTPYQRVEREQFVLAHSGRWSFGTSETALTLSRSENLGRSLPLTVQEREALQAIWNQALSDQGVSRGPALTDDIRAQLEEEFLPRPLRALDIRNTIFDTSLALPLGNHQVLVGGQYFDAEMEDGVFGMDGAGFAAGTAQKHEQTAVFAEDSWRIVEPLTVTFGARYDHHNIYGSQVSPRGYLVFRANDHWTVKGGVSTGYKTPKPNQLFPGIVGFGGQGVSPFVGTPDLQPETSVNYEAALYFDSLDRFSFNVTVFSNRFKDKIATADAVPNCFDANGERYLDSGCVDIGPGWAELGFTTFGQNTNIDRAETLGVEFATRWDITNTFGLRANYTYTDSEQKSGVDKGLPLVNTPEHMVNATLSWDATPRLNVSFITEIRDERFRGTATASGPQAVTRELYYKSYELFHLGARYRVNDALALHARVNNLFDKDMAGRSCELDAEQSGYDCANDYNVTEKARALWLSANYSF